MRAFKAVNEYAGVVQWPLKAKIVDFKESLKKKIVDANNELAKVKYDYKTN